MWGVVENDKVYLCPETATLAGRHKLNPTLETTRGQARVFKRLDAAEGVLFVVEFGEITIMKTNKSLLT